MTDGQAEPEDPQTGEIKIDIGEYTGIDVITDMTDLTWNGLRLPTGPDGSPMIGLATRIGRLPRSTKSGLSTVWVVITLPSGIDVLGWTTWRLWDQTSSQFSQLEKEEREDGPLSAEPR